MDKIWDRNPSKLEVIGRCGGDEKTNGHAELTYHISSITDVPKKIRDQHAISAPKTVISNKKFGKMS